MVNKKKALRLRTNTNHFEPGVTRAVNTFPSPHSHQSRSLKVMGYETRLYWQYRYCDEHNGATYFYTLTYNDKHLPRFYGKNCFDYEDLRDLLTGGFRKQLLRKYGTTFKYFIGAELGDGKGSRGIANNPHYHILFFLEDAHNERYPYIPIDPKEFRHLVREYWQGHDQDTDGWKDYRDFLYGVAKEGEPEGLKMATYGRVIDFRACMYCAKYVSKDAGLVQFEGKLRKMLAQDLYDKYYESDESYRKFYDECIVPDYEVYTSVSVAPWEAPFNEFDCPLDEAGFKTMYHKMDIELDTIEDIKAYIKEYDLTDEYLHFLRLWTFSMVADYIKLYRNRYCNKCRISQGVGRYAIEQPDFDPIKAVVPVPSKNGFEYRPINLYYYRQLFMDKHMEANGNVRYIINELGVQYKLENFPNRIATIAEKAKGYLSTIVGNRDLYNTMVMSDVNETIFSPYSEFFDDYGYLLYDKNNIEQITQRYAEYKYVYEDRFFAYDTDGDSSVADFPVINPLADYRKFITTIVISNSPCNLFSFFEGGCKGYMSYQSHPYFLPYIGIFNLLDLCTDYFFVQKDDKSQREAEERAAIKRFHSQEKLNEFYSRFQN